MRRSRGQRRKMQSKLLSHHLRRIASLVLILAAMASLAPAADSSGIRLSAPAIGWILAPGGSELIEITGIISSPRAGLAIALASAARRSWASPDSNSVLLRLDEGLFFSIERAVGATRRDPRRNQRGRRLGPLVHWLRNLLGRNLPGTRRQWGHSRTMARRRRSPRRRSVPDLQVVVGAGTTNISVDITLSKTCSQPITGDLALTSEANAGAADGEVNKPDPAVQLMPGVRRTRFEIPAGARSARVRLASFGTVAAQHRISVERLTIAGQAQVVAPVPALTDACYTTTGNIINVQLTG